MKKTVLIFGLISGLMISVLMDGSLFLADKIGSRHSMLLGYTIMVASFLLVYFGIRSYRDEALAGQISFGRAFACGILITLITTICYVATWEVLYFNFIPTSWTATLPRRFTGSSPQDLTRRRPRRRSRPFSTLSSCTRTPLSTWHTPLWSPCPSALSLLSSRPLSSGAKSLRRLTPLPQSRRHKS